MYASLCTADRLQVDDVYFSFWSWYLNFYSVNSREQEFSHDLWGEHTILLLDL